MHNMKKLILSAFVFTFGFATATHAQQVNTLFTKQLPEAPGKEIEVITVNYAPGAVDAIHRHDAHAVVYVLDGEVEMQVRGGTLRRLSPGQVFYESPEDRFSLPFTSFGALNFSDETILHKAIFLTWRHV
jgi:mannose-6-phosphate isomerase-like protein (cupin superfamily)